MDCFVKSHLLLVSRIRIRDPGWVKKTGFGSGMKNPDYIFRELRNQRFGLKYLNYFMRIRDGKNVDAGSGMETIRMRDPGWKNIPDPQHCLLRKRKFLVSNLH